MAPGEIRPFIINDILLITTGEDRYFAWVQLFSLTAAAGFNLLLVYLLIVRDKPVREIQRLAAAALRPSGYLPRRRPAATACYAVDASHADFGGAVDRCRQLASLLVLWRLGKSFSIMPEARTLVTIGPLRACPSSALRGRDDHHSSARRCNSPQPVFYGPILTPCWSCLSLVLTATVLRRNASLEEAYPEYAALPRQTARINWR